MTESLTEEVRTEEGLWPRARQETSLGLVFKWGKDKVLEGREPKQIILRVTSFSDWHVLHAYYVPGSGIQRWEESHWPQNHNMAHVTEKEVVGFPAPSSDDHPNPIPHAGDKGDSHMLIQCPQWAGAPGSHPPNQARGLEEPDGRLSPGHRPHLIPPRQLLGKVSPGLLPPEPRMPRIWGSGPQGSCPSYSPAGPAQHTVPGQSNISKYVLSGWMNELKF